MPETVAYKFHEKGKPEFVVKLSFDKDTFHILLPHDSPRPDWTKLEFQKCSNCPIEEGPKYCPAAVSIAHFLPEFSNAFSYTQAIVEVETARRIIVSKKTLQEAVASLVGLTMATSGCPRTEFLRPMSRFHLPFSDQRETVFRSLGTWLLTEYIKSGSIGEPVTLSFDGLKDAYANLSIVNSAFTERMRSAVSRDAVLNAVIILDTFAILTPDNVDGGFEDIMNIVSK